MDVIDYRTVLASVHPRRVAVLLNRNDPEWRESCLRIIEVFSQVWGGKHNLIVPTDGSEITEGFWQLVDVFDPDYLAQSIRHTETGRWRSLIPISRWWILEVARLTAEVETEPSQLRDHIHEHLSEAQADAFNVKGPLQRALKQRLAPFHFQDNAARMFRK